MLHKCSRIASEKACNRWMTLKVIQGHWHWCHSIGHIWYPILVFCWKYVCILYAGRLFKRWKTGQIKSFLSSLTCKVYMFKTSTRLAPEMIPIARNCAFELHSDNKHTHEIRPTRYFGILEACKTRTEIRNFYRCTPQDTNIIHVWSKLVQDQWSKGRVALVTK